VSALAKILIALLIPAYLICLLAPAVGYYHDDGVYLTTAKALATGQGYHIISLPSEMAQTKYPILYPALLAAIWKIAPAFPQNAVLLKAVSLLFTILWMRVTFLYLREFSSFGKQSWWVILITLLSPWIVFLSGTTMADTMFACLSLYAVLLLSRVADNRAQSPMRTVALAAVIASGAFLVRSAGVALFAAAFLLLLLRRMPKQLAIFLLICAILCGPWLLWQGANADPTDVVQLSYSKSSYGPGINIFRGFTLPESVTIVGLNIAHVYLSILTLAGFSYLPFTFALSLPLWLFVIVGAIRGGGTAWTPLRLWVPIYTGMLLCWAFPPYRFLTAVFPVLLMFCYEGFRITLGPALHKRTFQFTAAGAFLAMILFLGWQAAHDASLTLRTGTASAGGDNREDWSATMEMAKWIRENTPQTAVIGADSDPTVYLYTGRKAIHFFTRPYWTYYLANNPKEPLYLDRFEAHLRENHINYVLMTPMKMSSESQYFHVLLNASMNAHQRSFKLVHQSSTPGYALYEVDPAWPEVPASAASIPLVPVAQLERNQ
jgi:hypothetical protein